MRARILGAGLLMLGFAGLGHIGPASLAAQSNRTIALTFDDLPYAGDLPTISNIQQVNTRILEVLQRHKAPALGTVVENRLHVRGEEQARTQILERWVAAGMVLGNHSYDHTDFNTISVEEFKTKVLDGETITRRLMESRRPYQLYFQFPQTHTGDTAERKKLMAEFLSARGYKIVPHTIENQDFVFTVPYLHALRANDMELVARIRRAYLDFTAATTALAEQITPQVFGRDIPQTILLHATDITADCMEDLIEVFRSRGYRFVSLDEAMTDPAYQTPDSLVTIAGPSWLWRWMKSKNMAISFRDDPEPPSWVTDLYIAQRTP